MAKTKGYGSGYGYMGMEMGLGMTMDGWRLGYFKTCTSAETCSSCHSTQNIWKLNFFRPKGNKSKRKMPDFVVAFLAQPEPKRCPCGGWFLRGFLRGFLENETLHGHRVARKATSQPASQPNHGKPRKTSPESRELRTLPTQLRLRKHLIILNRCLHGLPQTWLPPPAPLALLGQTPFRPSRLTFGPTCVFICCVARKTKTKV